MTEGDATNMQRWQNQIDQLFERFQDRWDTDQSFRSTVSIGAVALTLLLLCGLVGTGLRVSANLLAGSNISTPTAALDSSEQNGPSGMATYTIAALTPAANVPGTEVPGGATPVSTTTTAIPTATTPPTPMGATPTPTTNPNLTPTTTSTSGTLSATQLGPFRANQSVTITITTSPPQPNAAITIAFNYGPGCVQNSNVTLDPGGQKIDTFTVASCLLAATPNFTAV